MFIPVSCAFEADLCVWIVAIVLLIKLQVEHKILCQFLQMIAWFAVAIDITQFPDQVKMRFILQKNIKYFDATII